MAETNLNNLASINFINDKEFLEHDIKNGRLDKILNNKVTLSAVPDGHGTTKWEARGSDGEEFRVFRLNIEPVLASGPVVIDTTEGVYVCYEDASAAQSWCVQVKSHQP